MGDTLKGDWLLDPDGTMGPLQVMSCQVAITRTGKLGAKGPFKSDVGKI